MSHKHLTVATIALFSASEHTHCTLVVCDSEWVTVALHSAFWVSTEVVTALFGCYMAGATWNCCRHGARSMHTIQPCTSLQSHFIWSHIRRMLVFSCNLPFALVWWWEEGGWRGEKEKNICFVSVILMLAYSRIYIAIYTTFRWSPNAFELNTRRKGIG